MSESRVNAGACSLFIGVSLALISTSSLKERSKSHRESGWFIDIANLAKGISGWRFSNSTSSILSFGRGIRRRRRSRSSKGKVRIRVRERDMCVSHRHCYSGALLRLYNIYKPVVVLKEATLQPQSWFIRFNINGLPAVISRPVGVVASFLLLFAGFPSSQAVTFSPNFHPFIYLAWP